MKIEIDGLPFIIQIPIYVFVFLLWGALGFLISPKLADKWLNKTNL